LGPSGGKSCNSPSSVGWRKPLTGKN
jgi:hypothetical protein